MATKWAAGTQPVSVTTSLTTTEEIRFNSPAFGRVHIPAGSSITTLTWYDAYEYGGDYVAAYDEDEAAVTQTVQAGRSYPIPITLAGSHSLKIVGDAAGTVYLVRK